MPLLLGVSIAKYAIVFLHKFKVKKRMFYANIVCYIIFCICNILIDYRDSLPSKS